MSKRIQSLFESEENVTILEANQELITEANQAILEFSDFLKAYILENIEEFVGSSLKETVADISVFTMAATNQFITEVSTITAGSLVIPQPVIEEKVEDYI